MSKLSKGDLVYVAGLPKKFKEWMAISDFWCDIILELHENKTILEVDKLDTNWENQDWFYCSIGEETLETIPEECLELVFTV